MTAADGDVSKRVLLPPLYEFRRENGRYSWSALVGLFGRESDPSEGIDRLCLPLYIKNRTPAASSWALFPFAIWERHRLGGGSEASPEPAGFESELSVMGPVFRHYSRPGFYRTDVLCPLFRVARGEWEGLNVRQVRALPLFSYVLKSEPAGGATGVKYERRLSVLWPLFSFYRDNYGPGYKRVDVLWPFFRYTCGCPSSPLRREKTFFFLPVTGWGKYWTRDASGALLEYRSEFYIADPVLSYVRSTRDGVRFRLLGPVLSYERNSSGDKDFRLLVKTVRAARIGQKRVFNIWPLLGSEWNPETRERKTIVLLGLFYYRRDGDGSTVKRILWFIPLGRRRPGKAKAPPVTTPAAEPPGTDRPVLRSPESVSPLAPK